MTEKIVMSEEFLDKQIDKLNDILDEIIDNHNYYRYNNESNISNLVEDAKTIVADIGDEGAFFSDIMVDLPSYVQDIVVRNGKIEGFNINEKQLEEDYGL